MPGEREEKQVQTILQQLDPPVRVARRKTARWWEYHLEGMARVAGSMISHVAVVELTNEPSAFLYDAQALSSKLIKEGIQTKEKLEEHKKGG
jgi:hypothetical protein